MATKEEIRRIIKDILRRRGYWQLSPRRKNNLALLALGMDEVAVFNFIVHHLKWQDYIEGPEPDDHNPQIPGDIWVFGMTIEDQMCYLKFQDRKNKVVYWIYIHLAKYQLHFPYQ